MSFFVIFIFFYGFHISKYEKNLRGWVTRYDCHLSDNRMTRYCPFSAMLCSRGGVEDTKLEAKAKDTKNFEANDRPSRSQGQGPRTQTQVLKKKTKNVFKNFFQAKKVFKKFFSGALYVRKPKKRSLQILRTVSGVFQQNFLRLKKIVLSSSQGQFSRT